MLCTKKVVETQTAEAISKTWNPSKTNNKNVKKKKNALVFLDFLLSARLQCDRAFAAILSTTSSRPGRLGLKLLNLILSLSSI